MSVLLRPKVAASLFGASFLELVLPAVPAHAQAFLSGISVYEHCLASGNTTMSWGLCRGYIIGALDAYEAANEVLHLRPLFCLPDGVTVEQAADVAVD